MARRKVGDNMAYRATLRVTIALVAAVTGLVATAGGALADTTQPQVTRTVSSLAFQSVVIDPVSRFAYFTVPSLNEVAVLDLKTGNYAKSIPVGSDPHGIDITPDGSRLFVADSGGQTISQVTTATRKVKTIITPPGFLNDTPYSIAVMNNGNALYSTTFAGSGFGANVYKLNLTTDTSTLVPNIGFGGSVTEATALSRSANHAIVGAVLGDDSLGPFDVYAAATGQVVSGSLSTFISSSALNATGTTMLVDGSFVINANTGSLLGTIFDSCVSAVLNASGETGYCLEAHSIVKLNITRFLTGESVALPSGVTGTGELAISPNGKLLVAETNTGATIVRAF